MKAVVFTGYGSIRETVQISDVPQPAPAHGQVLVEVHAAALNPIDYKLIRGDLHRIEEVKFPSLLGFDVSGVVSAVGPDVTGFQVGDSVFGRTPRDLIGTFAEYAVLDARHIATMPQGFSYVETAGIPLVGLTSMQALEDRAHAQAGQSILIHAGSGGLGTFAIQHAKLLGLHVTTTTSSGNEALVRRLGADEVVCYDRENYLDQPHRYDIVFDTLGGATTLDSFRVIHPGGVVVSVAGPPDRDFAADVEASFPVRVAMWFMNRGVYRRASAARASYYRFMTKSNGKQLARIALWMEAGAVKPVIDRVYRVGNAMDALLYLEQGRAKGKVILEVKELENPA